jgi:cell division inhibitor SepF
MSGAVDWVKEFFSLGGSKTPPPARPSATKSETRTARVARPQRRGYEVSSIETVQPNSYADAGMIAEVLRDSVPVIVNVQNLTDSDTRRLVDFMSGLKAGLQAESKRVAEHVYLLAPYGVAIDGDSDEVLEAESDRLIIRP